MQIFYAGRVQGVGFRYRVKQIATGFEVTGTVRNLPDGRVDLVAEGEERELEGFEEAIRSSELGSLIKNEEKKWSEAGGEFPGFAITN